MPLLKSWKRLLYKSIKIQLYFMRVVSFELITIRCYKYFQTTHSWIVFDINSLLFSDFKWNPIVHDILHSIFTKIPTLLYRGQLPKFSAFELLRTVKRTVINMDHMKLIHSFNYDDVIFNEKNVWTFWFTWIVLDSFSQIRLETQLYRIGSKLRNVYRFHSEW